MEELATLPGGMERSLALLDPTTRPHSAEVGNGYLDLLGGVEPEPIGVSQRLMLGGLVPLIYERYWRPAWMRAVKGPLGPGPSEERRLARLLLALDSGDGVLDIACGPGNYVREFARVVGDDGLVVGLDFSRTMLARAVADTPAARTEDGNVAYVRGDAIRLPFRDESFDAVCCFLALHMFADPWTALDSMARVLTPGGRIAILTTCRTRSALGRAIDGTVAQQSGMAMFERHQITAALEARGFVQIRRRVSGFVQFVGGVSA